ncbi:MAG: transcription antitermination factor NusB [Flavobacteriaceae bacterium]|nr:transcription antitermination factor NusB [Flavobacteriaceae bacterium]
MQILYALKDDESDQLPIQKQFLEKSMERMYDLYLLLLSLMANVQLKAQDHLVKSQQKHLATDKDKNPSYNFVNNQILQYLSNNKLLKEALTSRKLTNWDLDDEYVDLIFRAILKSQIYENYVNLEKCSFADDQAFVLDFFKTIIAPNDKLYDYFEDKNITWLDDLPVVNTAIVKLLKKIKPNSAQNYILPGLFKDREDKDFGFELLDSTISHSADANQQIAEKTTNWDKDRIANVDLVLLQMAICEFQHFPSIPVKVTINEYLEIAKEYSTPKSSVFINGILDKLVKEYEAKGKLNKSGRGLM